MPRRLLMLGAVTLLAACSADSAGPAQFANKQLQSVTIVPGTTTVSPGASQSFSVTANFTDGSNADVTGQSTFTATGGNINSNGVYTAGSSPGNYRVIATHSSGQTDTASIAISAAATGMMLNIQSWSQSQMQSAFGGSSLASLVLDPALGINVVRVRFPQSSGQAGPYLQGAVSLPNPTVSAWVRMLIKWEPGFTTVGPDPAGHDNSYKLFFILWQNYNARAGMGLSNGTRWNADWGISDRQTSVFYHPTETQLPGSEPLGSITTEWSDNEWYEYVFGQVQTAGDEVVVHHAFRRYTSNGSVNPGAWTHSIMSERGNMPAGLPVITRVSLGGNKNKNNPTDMYIRWGTVQIAQGANPFNVN